MGSCEVHFDTIITQIISSSYNITLGVAEEGLTCIVVAHRSGIAVWMEKDSIFLSKRYCGWGKTELWCLVNMPRRNGEEPSTTALR